MKTQPFLPLSTTPISKLLLVLLFFLSACNQEIPAPDTLASTANSIDCNDTPSMLDGNLIRNETREELFTIHDLHYSGEVSDISGLASYYANINPIFSHQFA